MFELVAGLTVVFAGYVLYEVFKTVSQTSNRPPVAGPPSESAKPAGETRARAEAPTESSPAPAPVVTPVIAERAESPSAGEPAAAEPATESAAEEKVIAALRNPATGETCPVPTNYRFAKKWVKDALVAEGLLDKIYKAADLDENGSQTVKHALERLKGIEKYQG